jgi:WD40 repeat protein/tRNA A-37 threonylcarbamoyl transferase component Bud32
VTGSPPDPASDTRRVTWLAAYDEALACRVAPPGGDGAAADDLAVLHLLDQLRPPRPAHSPAGSSRDPDSRYVLRGLHAEGGIGQVWLAFDNELGREVALKALRPDRAADAALAARFLHEAQVTGRLQHPGIVPVYELAPGVDPAGVDEPPFYTMRLVQGRTLTEAIQAYHARRAAGTASPVEKTTLLTAFVSVCHTIAYAHARGVIHRDLKPANVALGDYGEVVVLDWGFSKEIRVDRGQRTEDRNDVVPPRCETKSGVHSVAGQIMGTPAYMAPEQADIGGGRIDERTDVYGLGAILYELLTGQPPYPGEDTTEVLGRLRERPPPRPKLVRPRVPLALEAICLRAMARDPKDRYQSATEVAREVQHWLADEPVEAYREPPPARAMRFGRRHPALMAGALALVVTALFAAGLGEVVLRQQQALAAEERAKSVTSHALAMERAQEAQQLRLYLHRIALAERTIAANNPSGAMALLNDCPQHLRNWEWYCLDRLCRTELRPLRGHTSTVHAVTFAPDGGTLASGGFDHTIRFWDAATGLPRGVLTGHSGVIYDLSYSPDGTRLASASWDGTVRVWDTATRGTVLTLGGHGGHVEFVRYSPDGRRIYSLAADQSIRAWDAATGRLQDTFRPGWRPWSLSVSADGKLLGVGCADGVVRLLEAATWREVRLLEGHRYPVRAIAFSPKGDLLATGDGDMGRDDVGEVKVWEVPSGREIFGFRNHTDPILRVAFADNTRLASASQDQTVKIWDLQTGQEALTLRAHSDTVRCVAFSSDGRRLASAGADRLVHVWDTAAIPGDTAPAKRGTAPIRTIAAHADRALAVAFGRDGREIASVGADRTIRTWDPLATSLGSEPLQAFQLPRLGDRVPGADADYFAVTYSPEGDQIATANTAGTVLILDATGHPIHVLTGHGAGPIRGLAYRPRRRQLASAGWDRSVVVWDVEVGKKLRSLQGHTEPVNGVAYAPDGHWLASAGNDQTVRIWDAESGVELRSLRGHSSGVLAVAVSPDGSVLASVGNDGTVRLWDTTIWRVRAVLREHTSGVRAVAFAPDGRRFATAGNDWTVRVWRASDGEEVTALRGHTDRVHGLAFSPDGRTLASVGYDGTVRLWDAAALDE